MKKILANLLPWVIPVFPILVGVLYVANSSDSFLDFAQTLLDKLFWMVTYVSSMIFPPWLFLSPKSNFVIKVVAGLMTFFNIPAYLGMVVLPGVGQLYWQSVIGISSLVILIITLQKES